MFQFFVSCVVVLKGWGWSYVEKVCYFLSNICLYLKGIFMRDAPLRKGQAYSRAEELMRAISD